MWVCLNLHFWAFTQILLNELKPDILMENVDTNGKLLSQFSNDDKPTFWCLQSSDQLFYELVQHVI